MDRVPKLRYKYVGNPDVEYTPNYATSGASGADIRNATDKVITLYPHTLKSIPTGICVEIPEGFEGQLRPRSGISVKKQLVMLPTVGSIDADFRGELMCNYFNLSDKVQTIDPGERIAQLIIAPCVQVNFTLSSELSETDRGSGGFGSTGK